MKRGKGTIVTYFIVFAIFGIVLMLTADPLADFLQYHIPLFPVGNPNALEKLKRAISDVGIGFFATAVLMATVGEVGLRRLAGEVETRLAVKIRTAFDDPALPAALENIFNPAFVHLSYKLTIKLDRIDDHPDLLKVTIGVECPVKNVSQERQKYEVQAWLDYRRTGDSSIDEMGRFTSLYLGPDYPRPDLRKYQRIENKNVVLEGLPAVQIDPGHSIDVKMEGIQIMRADDRFVWNMSRVTGKVDVEIRGCEKLKLDAFDVYLRAMHHTGRDAFAKNVGSNVITAHVKSVFLPYQGIEIFWGPKRS